MKLIDTWTYDDDLARCATESWNRRIPLRLILDYTYPIIGIMKTTVDIPDDVMKDAMKLTKASSKRDAVVGAMQEYIRREKMAQLVKHLGTFKEFMTHEELMDMRLERGKYADRSR